MKPAMSANRMLEKEMSNKLQLVGEVDSRLRGLRFDSDHLQLFLEEPAEAGYLTALHREQISA